MVGTHEMTEGGETDWKSTIRKCGLEVLETPPVPGSLDPAVAALAVTGGNVRPVVAVAKEENSLSILDMRWKEVAAPLIAGHGGKFLIILWGPGSIRKGWFRVREPEPAETGLPSRVCAAIGRPEFSCLSLDNKMLYAVTVEQGEYWVVTHQK
ncbi:hypothetical protein SALBM311S_03423 [Streptomyces alboniger]